MIQLCKDNKGTVHASVTEGKTTCGINWLSSEHHSKYTDIGLTENESDAFAQITCEECGAASVWSWCDRK